MKRVFSMLQYVLIICLLFILCYGIMKKDPYLIRLAGFLCAFWTMLLLYEKIHKKNKAAGIALLTLSGLFLILSIITFLGL